MQKLDWGHKLGEAHGIPAYSNVNFKWDRNRANEYNSYLYKSKSNLARDVYLGFQYQCVEYARRFLVYYSKTAFMDVGCAYHIWELSTVEDLTKQVGKFEFRSLPQGGLEPPQVGDLIIYYKSNKQPYGHVAVVTHVGPDFVDICEQNYEETHWENQNYARRLNLKVHNGKYEITNVRKGQEHRTQYWWDRNERIYGWKRVIK